MNAVIGELITSGSTNATQLRITDAPKKQEYEFMILIVSGSVKWGKSAASVNGTAHPFAVGDKIIIKTDPDELYFKATGATDTFVVT